LGAKGHLRSAELAPRRARGNRRERPLFLFRSGRAGEAWDLARAPRKSLSQPGGTQVGPGPMRIAMGVAPPDFISPRAGKTGIRSPTLFAQMASFRTTFRSEFD